MKINDKFPSQLYRTNNLTYVTTFNLFGVTLRFVLFATAATKKKIRDFA